MEVEVGGTGCGEKRGRNGERKEGIAGFGNLHSRAGFTVNCETRTPGLD